MTNPFKTDAFRSVALLLARLPLGIFFLLAGYIKLKGGLANFVNTNTPTIPSFLPVDFGRSYLWMLPFVEMLAGLALAIGLFTRLSASLIALMLISFIIATGVGFSIDKAPYFSPNLIYLGLALVLISTGGGQMAVDQSFGKSAPGPAKK